MKSRHTENRPRAEVVTPSSVGPGVLVADDDEAIRRLVDSSLQERNFAVWLAADGQEAVELYQRYREFIDVVLLDVRMPVMDGLQAVCMLRALDAKVRCCLMTGDSGPYTLDELRDLGVARVMAKPFPSLNELARVLRELAEERKADHEDVSRASVP